MIDCTNEGIYSRRVDVAGMGSVLEPWGGVNEYGDGGVRIGVHTSQA